MGLSLKTFTPEPDAPGRTGPVGRAQVRQIEQRAYERGIRDGAAAAAEAAAQEETHLTKRMCEALEDALLARAQMEAALNRETQRTLDALMNVLLPKAMPAGLAAQVSHHVAAALNAAPRVHPVVVCAPEHVAALTHALRLEAERCSVQAAPELAPNRAEIRWDQCETWIDLEPVVLAMTDALSSGLAQPPITTPERRAHGQ